MPSRPDINWNTVRPLRGSRSGGFEELCAQLARAECPANARFVRKGTPDAGVECFAILQNGDEWGWQAKYFSNLDDSQWAQLDESVRNALEKHSRLVRYIICVPLDRPDARIDGRRSAMDRWTDHTTKWTGWASDQGMTVEFVYWGSSELIGRLSRPQHAGRVRFWFDVARFDTEWFAARLEESIKAAGPRYTPELHVDLPIAKDFDAFGRTPRIFDEVKTHGREIRKALRFLAHSTSEFPELNERFAAAKARVDEILEQLANLTVQPIGELPFAALADQLAIAEDAVFQLASAVFEAERRRNPSPTSPDGVHGRRAPSDWSYFLSELSRALRHAHRTTERAAELTSSPLLILHGEAGTGKTHLFCDVTRARVSEGRPTLLLMGQRFTSEESPWVQLLQQLDLADLSVEEFVGALEGAAQAADARALILVDAVNEGTGKRIWPANLAAFLAAIERSPWISVALSVRSSFEDIVIPEEVRDRAYVAAHRGFESREDQSLRQFFAYFDLELPSTPLLTPEFRNPLFLKILCKGLQDKGMRRLPRGTQGITMVFDTYLDTINTRLAGSIDFNPKRNLVREALQSIAQALVACSARWLPMTRAEDIVNALLPGREFGRSLYHALVSEGVLLEDVSSQSHGSQRENVTLIAYERLADYLIAGMFLEAHVSGDPARVFVPNGPFAFLWNTASLSESGLLEAMCVQVPERTGKELFVLAPDLESQPGMVDAFLQSLVWRSPSAFSQQSRDIICRLLHDENYRDRAVDALLTIATVPGHPLNASFLDETLRAESMPDRDAWWSICLHRLWRTRSALDRLVDWTRSVDRTTTLDDDAVELAATALVWTLTTSDRFVRDHATQCLVTLLSGRLSATRRFVDRFANVDDPYVVERLYAVAYGVAMRTDDPDAIAGLASAVYERVFAAGRPPAQILLRDYARGVVERAVHLRANIQVDLRLIRPPYRSDWPHIPSEEDIRPLLPDWSRGSYDSEDLEWARNRIGSSVLHDDFARYVIGTNSGSTNWLSLELDEPAWKSSDERLADLVTTFSQDERAAWESFKEADERARRIMPISILIHRYGAEDVPTEVTSPIEAAGNSEIRSAESARDQKRAQLESVLAEDHLRSLDDILSRRENSRDAPRFDLGLIQRYILWRVFDLGWTVPRFGHFDRFEVSSYGRDARKAERMGKKYQWIAYHEILALIADHFQYREESSGDVYEGPWQDGLRDIDPSYTLQSESNESNWWDPHSLTWWAPTDYSRWEPARDATEWVEPSENDPPLSDFLRVTNPEDGSTWINADGYLSWGQRPPLDREVEDVERREIWYMFTGYLIRQQDVAAFLSWARGVDFWNHWMPRPSEFRNIFLGEHGWSPAARWYNNQIHYGDGWDQPERGCPARLVVIPSKYIRESGGFDCSLSDGYSALIPSNRILSDLRLQWNGEDAVYLDVSGRVVVTDPALRQRGPQALLLRENLLSELLRREDLTVCWIALGEKRSLGPGHDSRMTSARLSGAYALDGQSIRGFLERLPSDPPREPEPEQLDAANSEV